MLTNDKEMSGPVFYNLPYYCTTVNYCILLTKKLQKKGKEHKQTKKSDTQHGTLRNAKKKSSKEKKDTVLN